MMKLFALGAYVQYGTFALIMAKNEEEAYEKLRNLEKDDLFGIDDKAESFDDEIRCLLKSKNMVEVKKGIYISEHE